MALSRNALHRHKRNLSRAMDLLSDIEEAFCGHGSDDDDEDDGGDYLNVWAEIDRAWGNLDDGLYYLERLLRSGGDVE